LKGPVRFWERVCRGELAEMKLDQLARMAVETARDRSTR
jgi:hypothetical protein